MDKLLSVAPSVELSLMTGKAIERWVTLSSTPVKRQVAANDLRRQLRGMERKMPCGLKLKRTAKFLQAPQSPKAIMAGGNKA